MGCSVDGHATEALLAGAEAWYSVVGGLFPAPCMRILSSVRAGDANAARQLDARLRPLWDLFGEFGSLRVIYAAARLLGLCDALPLRRIGDVLERLALD